PPTAYRLLPRLSLRTRSRSGLGDLTGSVLCCALEWKSLPVMRGMSDLTAGSFLSIVCALICPTWRDLRDGAPGSRKNAGGAAKSWNRTCVPGRLCLRTSADISLHGSPD